MTEASRAYDAIAARYDALRRENAILAHMREQSLAALRRAMPEAGRLLEIGCGTAEEATVLLNERGGLHVDAIDPSPEMLAIARARREPRLRLFEAAASDLEKLEGPYDGAWSSFALSYEPDLAPVARSLASLLRPGAPFVLSLRNPWCAAEWWSVPRRASGRYRHKVGDARVPIRHWGLREARAALERAGFSFERARALPLLLPPPRYGRLAPAPRWLRTLDAACAGTQGLRALGDHTLIEVRRGERPPLAPPAAALP